MSDMVKQVVEVYCEGGNLNDYERLQVKHALYESNGKKPEHVWPIALRLVDSLLRQAEREAGKECRHR